MSDGDDRAERLRQRRKRSQDKASERAEPDEQSEPSEPSKSSKPSESDETDEPDKTDETGESDEDGDDGESVKKEREGTYMYLPADQKSELSYQFKRLSAEYEREYGNELEKNRHFYPLVISHGLDSLDGWDVEELRNAIEDLGL